MATSTAASDRTSTVRQTVLHVLSGFSIAGTLGGAERVAATIIKGLENSPGYTPVLCVLRAPDPGAELHGLTAPVRHLGYVGPDLDWRMAARSVMRLRRTLREVKPDIVHSHLWLAAFTTGLALLGTGIPHVIHIQDQRAWLSSPLFHQKLRRAFHRFLIRANKTTFVACSQATADFTKANLGPLTNQMTIVRSGTDLDRFKDFPEPPGLRRPGQTVVVGMVARMIPEKGVAETIRACAVLRDKKSPFRLRLAGTGASKSEFERLTSDLGLGEQVEFVGLVKDILRFYADLDVLVLPSLSTEGIPISVLEAMAAGRPVVVAASSGIPEAVSDGMEGFVVPPGDTAALADALERLIADAALRREMGSKAKARIQRDFNAEDMVRDIMHVYGEILGGAEAESKLMRAALKFMLKLALACAIFVVTFELACSLYAARLRSQWSEVRQKPDHYFQTSSNPVLGYELKPGTSLSKEGRRLNINRVGIRDDADAVPAGVRKIALLGDSVVFGTGFSQDETISAFLQQALDPATNRLRVLNFGVPGYNLPELVEQLSVKDAVYHADDVVYVMNPNDFCRRNTMTEGADNGLYRMYCEPRFKSIWFLRKLIYRLHKGDPVTPEWYSWIFDCEHDAGFRDLETIASHCAAAGQHFTVVFLPAGCAYLDGTYVLADMDRGITSHLERRGIAFIDTVAEFGESPRTLLTETDHLTVEGNRLMAGLIATSYNGSRAAQ